ncbi:protein arginine N-methyltransferase [Chloropicon primus]|uniref:Protein arginine N-methyltransferase n=2 Tax=Chloropicon primus TaxID=1764295 RepID=A0A5B8MTW6_9CHLO|nr:protein arginine N-methyltransferase [Chloropicon primus]UPR03044.1 protein arginine N-methyltransferase [Chloropicon primus]|eukprot:QDZ23831.1 protein arginine N-methyltransferase [Chloropicon primus]
MADKYFESYDDINVHRLMLEDKPRTEAYKKAFESLGKDLKGKVVLDVGAGTGILSLFAAKCGAARVYAVEASGIAAHTQEVVAENNLQEVVRVLQCKIEDAGDIIKEKVDVIVSEWMGFYLLHESMLGSVLTARDMFLKPGGLILPRTAKLYASPINMEKYCNDRFMFWTDVYGFSMQTFIAAEAQAMLGAPVIENVERMSLLSEPQLVKEIDCQTAKPEDLKAFSQELKFVARKEGICHGFCFWFDCHFENGVVLSTAPGKPHTHWKQATLMLPEMLQSIPNVVRLDCKVGFVQSEANERQYQITLEM